MKVSKFLGIDPTVTVLKHLVSGSSVKVSTNTNFLLENYILELTLSSKFYFEKIIIPPIHC